MIYKKFELEGRGIRLETFKLGLPASIPGMKQPEESSTVNLFCDDIYVGEIKKSEDLNTLRKEAKDLLEEQGYL